MAKPLNPEDAYLVRTLLYQYDALRKWTVTQGRYVEMATGWSEAKARRLTDAVRKEDKRNRLLGI